MRLRKRDRLGLMKSQKMQSASSGTGERKQESPFPTSRVRDKHLSQKGFAPLPTIGDIPGFSQAIGSLDASSSSSRASAVSTRRGARLREGDLITGTINVVNERAHIVPAAWSSKHAEEKTKAVCAYLSLVDCPA